jgi:hypothetical protein
MTPNALNDGNKSALLYASKKLAVGSHDVDVPVATIGEK